MTLTNDNEVNVWGTAPNGTGGTSHRVAFF